MELKRSKKGLMGLIMVYIFLIMNKNKFKKEMKF